MLFNYNINLLVSIKKDAVQKLNQSGKYELFIATSAPWKNHESATHKRVWLEKHFKGIFEKK